jgi:hypothetical protein
MPAPQILLQAALQRLSARLGSTLVDAAAQLSLLAQDTPDKVRQELELFWQEVELEADRLERGDDAVVATAPAAWTQADSPFQTQARTQTPQDPQAQIDALRAQVASLVRRLDQQPQAPASQQAS